MIQQQLGLVVVLLKESLPREFRRPSLRDKSFPKRMVTLD